MTTTKKEVKKATEAAEPAVEKTEEKTAVTEVVIQKTQITLATKITLFRILVVPIIIFFYLCGGAWGIFQNSSFLIRYGKLIALLLFGIAAISDTVDGYIARKYNQVTDIGKMLDPIADKILTLAGFILIALDFDVMKYGTYGDGFLPVWFAVLAIFIAFARDHIVNGLRFVAIEKGVTIAADRYGKAKSLIQYVAIGLFMIYAFDAVQPESYIGFGTGTFLDIYQFTALFALALATVLTMVSAANYLYQYRELYLGKREKKDWGEK